MSLVLVAYSPADGTGFLKTDGEVRFIQPPYDSKRSLEVTDESIGEAVTKYGYTSTNHVFQSYETLINFLNQEVVSARNNLESKAPESLSADLIDLAPIEVLLDFLDRIERDLIPRGAFDHAQNALISMLECESVLTNGGLLKRVVDLMKRSNTEKIAHMRLRVGISDNSCTLETPKRPSETEKYNRLAARFRQKHCMIGA